MAVSFASIQADVLSLLNALTATTAATAETAYTNAAAGTVASLSTDWPVTMIQESILDSEYHVIYEICLNPIHPERSDFNKTSSTLATGAVLPSTASDSTPFLGTFSYVKNNTNGNLLTERPLQIVKYAIENTNSMFALTPAIYAITGNTIHFTSGNAPVIVGPGAARATWTGNIRCRDHWRPAIVAGAMVRLLPKEGAWLEAMAPHAQLWADFIGQIRNYGLAVAKPTPSQT